jgi:hypothetical protein
MPGPYYFAWADSDETTFGPEHVREDEKIFSYSLTHTEGDFALLELEVRNPNVGLLAPGRQVWAWFAYDIQGDPNSEIDSEGMSSASEPSELGITPLFFGRLLGVPANINAEVVTLQFIARPTDYVARQAAAAEPLKVRPFYDPIWFDPKDLANPDNILESRPELWHIDRVTHEVTTSDIITGEDGVIEFDEDNVFYDSVAIEYGEPPARRVEVTASVSWEQVDVNTAGINLAEPIYQAFRRIGSAPGSSPAIASYTGAGLQSDWPKLGARLGDAWTVTASGLTTGATIGPGEFNDKWPYGRHSRAGGFDKFSPEEMQNISQQSQKLQFSTGPLVPGYNMAFAMFEIDIWGSGRFIDRSGGLNNPGPKIWFPLWHSVPTLKVGYDISRPYRENISFALEADVQSLVTDSTETDVIQLSFESAEVVSPVDDGDLMPIRDQRARTYFASARGSESIEYLIMVARAQLLARARAVSVTFETDIQTGFAADLSCRKSAVLSDPRLPGGMATGKVVAYTLSGNGDSGVFGCSVKIGCAIGRGDTVSASPGSPTYVAEGYVSTGYQRYDGGFVVPVPGEVAYTPIEGQLPNDDGIDLIQLRRRDAWRDIVLSCSVSNGMLEQEAAMAPGAGRGDAMAAFKILNDAHTEVSLTLKPLKGSFLTEWEITTSALMVPKLIDLEAP